MYQLRDYLHRYTKGGCSEIEGRCRVRSYLPAADDVADRPLVLCSEPPIETGYEGPSVTNEAEYIACGLVEELPELAEAVRSDFRAGEEPPFYFVEHYPRGNVERFERASGLRETFDFVTFGSYGPIQRSVAGRGYRVLGEPDWESTTCERVEELTGGTFEPGAEAAYFGAEPVREKTRKAGAHCRIETAHGMLPPLPFDHATGNVMLRRVADFEGGLDLGDHLQHKVQTNVPWSVVEHSPDGFLWGYGGSGPADLALNVLNAFVPPRTDGRAPAHCYEGEASETAYALHQRFKEDFLAGLPWEGGTIPGEEIRNWIERRVVRVGGEVVGYLAPAQEPG